MPAPTLRVIHNIPGRIRLRLPALNGDSDYENLQNQVQSLAAVKAVRINPAARSIVIQYDQHDADFSTHLATALGAPHLADVTLQKNAHTAARASESSLPPDCEVIQLTPYEQTQFEAVKTWKHRQISGLKEIIGHLLMATKGLLNVLFLNRILGKAASFCEMATAAWQKDWEYLKPLAGVEEVTAMRQGTLESCDQLAEHATKTALAIATTEGSFSGLLDIFGEIADEELMLILALQTIHRTGLCYGYAPQSPDEQAFSWAIFSAAISLTQEEYEKTQTMLRSIQRSLNKQALEDETLEDTVEEDINEMLVDSAIEQVVTQLSGETFAGVAPILSLVMNIFADRDLIEQVSQAAKREFQLRWLLENQKVRFPQPSPS